MPIPLVLDTPVTVPPLYVSEPAMRIQCAVSFSFFAVAAADIFAGVTISAGSSVLGAYAFQFALLANVTLLSAG